MKITWNKFGKLSFRSLVVSQVVHDEYLTSMKKWFADYLKLPAIDLNSYVVVNTFEKMKQRGLCFQHMRRQRSILRNVFEFGMQSGMLPNLARSPTMEVVLKKDTEKKPEILTFSEIQTLLQPSRQCARETVRASGTHGRIVYRMAIGCKPPMVSNLPRNERGVA